MTKLQEGLKMKKKSYIPKVSLKPINLSKYVWLYVDKRGIDIIHEIRRGVKEEYVRTDSIRITYKKFLKEIKLQR